jgi:diphthamide synthase (EF-2-diphthine--ammonia ligase)
MGDRREFADLFKGMPQDELTLHALIVGPQEADVWKIHTEDREALEAEAECPAVPLTRVDAEILKHRGAHDTASQHHRGLAVSASLQS